MKRRMLILVLIVLVAQVLGAGEVVAKSLPVLDVAFVHDREASDWGLGFRDSLRRELLRILDVDYTVRMPAELEFMADGTPASAREALERALAQPEVDLVIASGPLGSLEAGRLSSRALPVIGTWIMDTSFQNVPFVNGTSGTSNYTYVTTGDMVSADLEALERVIDYRHLAVLGSQQFVESLPGEDELPEDYGGRGLTFVIADDTVEGTLARIPAEADAVYLLPVVEMTRAETIALLGGLAERGLPVLAMFGEPDVRAGALVGVAPNDWLRRIYRRVALAASRIMAGEDAADLPVTMMRGGQLYLNMTTARRVGVSPPFEVIIEAVTVDDPLPPGIELVDLSDVMARVQAGNRDIASTEAAVAAGAEQVGVAKGNLLPQISIGLDGSVIDKDSATFFPSTSERTFSGGASLTQIIWSDRAWAGYSIEKHLQNARIGELNQVRLDVGLEGASAYVEVLRAQTDLGIQRQNLSFSRSNLERAKVRVAVGDANRSELYRWQSKIAGEQTRVMDAAVGRRLAFFELNRVLSRPLDNQLDLVDATVDDQFQVVVDSRVDRYIKDPESLDILREFLVKMGLANSPEIQQFDASILASERAHTAANRSFWSPDVGLTGGIDHIFSRGGEGSSIDDFLMPDDTSWNIGVFVSLPLLEGGARFAETRRTTQETFKLRRAREATVERIEQSVQSSTFQVAASRLAINLARKATEAAELNLALVADNYTLGRVSLVDLLDAQTNALNTQLAEAKAVNDYLLDLMRVERTVGRFMFFVSAEDKEAWIGELEAFATTRR